MKQIPNIFTLLNLIFGCIAIVMVLQTDSIHYFSGEEFVGSFDVPENIALGALLLYAAAVVDFLDGFVARMFKATSEMGKQLDSLADVVSFGVAPGVILYQLLRMAYMSEAGALDTPVIYLYPAFIISAAAAYRLAKFNIDDSQTYGFRGVPTPAAGLLVASFPLILHFGTGMIDVNVNEWLINKWAIYSTIIALSWLMVSNLPIMAMKFRDFTLKNNMPKIILGVIAILSIILFKWLAVPVIFIAYIILSLALNKKQP